MSKITFFYCTGTAYGLSALNDFLKIGLTGTWHWGDPSVNPDQLKQVSYYVEGLNGKTYPWDGAVFNDPFPFMLDTTVWEPVRVSFADSAVTILTNNTIIGGMGNSINDGVNKVMARINALPPGAPFAIGGYSQGAAVMSQIYNEIRSGSLSSRNSSFLGGVMFGNPRRQENFRGEIGGTWSGAWDDPNSNTGGHGSFPATGPWARLSGCEGTRWIEFANPLDIITSTGNTTTGQLWTQGNEALLTLNPLSYGGQFVLEAFVQAVIPQLYTSAFVTAVQAAGAVGGALNYLIDLTGTPGAMPGGGHVLYPVLPPPDSNGVIPVTTVPITSTYTTSGVTVDVAGVSPRTGRLVGGATSAVTKTITKNYSKKPASVDSCYQLALKWLESKAAQYAVAPIVLPSTTAGWSTTLVPPAS